MSSQSLGAEAKRELAWRELARREFSAYAEYVYRGWPRRALHLRLLGGYLQEVEKYLASRGEEGIGRLMIFMPPRHWKSTTVSVIFPTWVLGRNPDHRVILTSYNGSLAMGFSRRARNLMMDTQYRAVFGDRSGRMVQVEISRDSRSVETWNINEHHGGMVAAGVGGGITGKGANLFIIDDPVKDRADAESLARREAIEDWYQSTAYTRLEEGAALILIMTRWHEDDLAGRLLRAMVAEEGADQWTVLNLPAVAEEWAEAVEGEAVIEACRDGWWRSVDALGRQAGEVLWPGKYPLEVLETIRAVIGGYEWDALYQQRPRRLEGALIKAHEIHVVPLDEVPEHLRVVRYWDLAVSGRDRADYIVGAKVGRGKDGRIYILDVVRMPGPWADARPRMITVMERDGITVTQGIEVAGQQGGYFQELQRDDRLQIFSLQAVNPRDVGNKEVRANVWASRIEDGLVYMVRAGWNDAFVSECLAFPRGAHDDQVDGVSGAVQMLPMYVSFADVPQAVSRGSVWDLFGEGVAWPVG